MPYLFFLLLILVGNLEIYRHFQYYFSGADQLKTQVTVLKDKLRHQELNTFLVRYQFDEFKQDVAVNLPLLSEKFKSSEEGYTARNIASLVTVPTEFQKIETSASLFEKGKKLFRDKEFEKSNKVFRHILQKYPESIHSIEAQFFLVEGLFQNNEYEECLATIETMMTHFPENELTGFSLLRLGKVFEIQERFEDAVEVYKTVIHNYQNNELKAQAAVFLRAIKL